MGWVFSRPNLSMFFRRAMLNTGESLARKRNYSSVYACPKLWITPLTNDRYLSVQIGICFPRQLEGRFRKRRKITSIQTHICAYLHRRPGHPTHIPGKRSATNVHVSPSESGQICFSLCQHKNKASKNTTDHLMLNATMRPSGF